MLKTKGKQRVRHITQELLEQSSDLNWVVVRQIDRVWISIDVLCKLLQAANVTILSENSLDGEIYKAKYKVRVS